MSARLRLVGSAAVVGARRSKSAVCFTADLVIRQVIILCCSTLVVRTLTVGESYTLEGKGL